MTDDSAPPLPPPEGPGSMPGFEAPPAPVAVARPASIALAVKLMYAGAVLSLLSLLATIITRDSIRAAVQKASTDAATPLTRSQVDSTVGLVVGASIVSGLIGIALWLWMASANGRGRKWARVVATVFFGLSVLFTLGSLVQKPPALSLALGIVSLLLGAYIMVLLYRRESTAYYDGQSAPRY